MFFCVLWKTNFTLNRASVTPLNALCDTSSNTTAILFQNHSRTLFYSTQRIIYRVARTSITPLKHYFGLFAAWERRRPASFLCSNITRTIITLGVHSQLLNSRMSAVTLPFSVTLACVLTALTLRWKR